MLDISSLPLIHSDVLEEVIYMLELAIANTPDHEDVKLWKTTVAAIDIELDSR